jgi:multiple sugar transport system substrate-binding protein
MKKIFVSVLFLILTVGCANNDASKQSRSSEGGNPVSEQTVSNKLTEQISLQIYDGVFSEPEFKQIIEAPLQKKYPNATFVRIPRNGDIVEHINGLVTAKMIPDIFLLSNFSIDQLYDSQAFINLAPLIKKSNTDLSKFDSVMLDVLKKKEGSHDLFGLPIYKNVGITLFNKDLFDKFGVPYPKIGMTWDDFGDLAKKLTRQADGMYYGGSVHFSLIQGQLAIPIVDAQTHKATLTKLDAWKQLFQTTKQINDILHLPKSWSQGDARQHFWKDKDLAMQVDWTNNAISQAVQAANSIQWDIVTMPVFKTQPKHHSKVDFHAVTVSSTTKHADEAMEVVKFLTTSSEVQQQISETGRIPAINDTSLIKFFGQKLSQKQMNTDAIIQTYMTPLPKQDSISENNKLVGSIITAALNDVLDGNQDINSALRSANEMIDQNVAAYAGK